MSSTRKHSRAFPPERSALTDSPHQFNRHAVQIKTRDDIAPREMQAKHMAVEADGSVEIRNAMIDCVRSGV
jgi:hypothetical protein